MSVGHSKRATKTRVCGPSFHWYLPSSLYTSTGVMGDEDVEVPDLLEGGVEGVAVGAAEGVGDEETGLLSSLIPIPVSSAKNSLPESLDPPTSSLVFSSVSASLACCSARALSSCSCSSFAL